MDEAVYKIVELAGSSKTDIEAAIQNALSRASKTIRNIRWFQAMEIRGYMENDRIDYWQVTIKVGFKTEDNHTEKKEIPPVEIKQNQKPQENKGASRYRCKVCGYIYDPEKGDPSQDIKPGTSFEDLPDSWKCPECGVGKDQFEKVS